VQAIFSSSWTIALAWTWVSRTCVLPEYDLIIVALTGVIGVAVLGLVVVIGQEVGSTISVYCQRSWSGLAI
jgi:hypothetical protein